MAQQRAPGFRIVPEAWKEWEFQTCPARLDAIVDRLFGLGDDAVTLQEAHDQAMAWVLRARLDGALLVLVGSRNTAGAWTVVHVVLPIRHG